MFKMFAVLLNKSEYLYLSKRRCACEHIFLNLRFLQMKYTLNSIQITGSDSNEVINN